MVRYTHVVYFSVVNCLLFGAIKQDLASDVVLDKYRISGYCRFACIVAGVYYPVHRQQ